MYQSFFDELCKIGSMMLKTSADVKQVSKLRKLAPWLGGGALGAAGLSQGEKAVRRYRIGRQYEEAQGEQ
jgi:hypothetical protein